MAIEFYVEQADRSPHSGLANESIYAGELVSDEGAGVSVLTFGDSGEGAGLARFDAEAMAAEDYDEVVEEVYDTDQRVQYQPFEDSAVVRIRTPEDNGTDPAPDIGHQNVVGIVDASALQGTADEFQGRVVQEGYSDGTTTFDRASDNFKAVGVAYRPDQNPAPVAGQQAEGFDYPVRVVLFSELKE